MKPLIYSLVSALCALLAPTAAHAGFVANSNGPSITISGAGIADDRYPATLKVEGGDGPIAKVRAFITLTHSDPEGFDLALVPPTFGGSILMSDVCGPNLVTNLTLVFDQADPGGVGPLPTATSCSSGAFPPTNSGGGDSWPAPGPGALSTTNLDSFIGRNPNGDWKLFGFNDVNTNGNIGLWGLEITTTTANIVVPAVGSTSGVANQYPLTKAVDLPDGQVIDDLNLQVKDYNHQHPLDVDILLQGPSGDAVMVMSDACGTDDINLNFDWTIDDEAAAPFSENSTACAAPSFKPTDFGTPPEDLPAPAPARPYSSTLSTFDGLQGGTFRLFINDDGGADTGYIDALDVVTTTRAAAPTGFASTTVATAEGQTAQLTVNRTGPANLGPATVDVGVTDGEADASDFTAPASKLTFARGETSKTISIPIGADFQGEEPETFFVTLSNPANDAGLADATSFATVTIARSESDNRFTLGDVTKKRNGSAEIPVTVPGAGAITAVDDGPKSLLKPADAFAEKAGTTVLKLKPAKKAKRKLKKGKKVKLTAEITYTPDGGSANSKQAPVTLKKKKP